MKRYKHTLSHYRMITGNMGELLPVSSVPVLPGDTIEGYTTALIRVSPLNAPVMHPVTVRTHSWFIPNRIVLPEWEDFITGGPNGDDPVALPISVKADDNKDVPSYLGVPNIEGLSFQNLPLRGYNKVFNQRYRDQDLVPEKNETSASVQRIAWEKSYYTTARPWTQKGPDVTLPLGDTAPVRFEGGSLPGAVADFGGRTLDTSGTRGAISDDPGSANSAVLADLALAESPNVNEFRAAFALQRYQEARARYGSRFTEYLRYLGVTPSDARLQEPEYLGGGTTRLNFSEVLQTGPGSDRNNENLGVGDMYGHGIAGVRTARWRKFFEEHGYVLTLLSVRPKEIYRNALPRDFLKRTKEDFWQKELQNLGQQEVYAQELHGGSTPDTVFGYQDRYQEYRSHPSQVSNDFDSLLNAYHMARDLAPNPVLNESFIACNPTDRIFQVGTDVADSLWCMVNNHMVARRLVSKRASPRII